MTIKSQNLNKDPQKKCGAGKARHTLSYVI